MVFYSRPAFTAHFPPSCRIFQQFQNRHSDAFDIAFIYQQTGLIIFDHLWNVTYGRCHDWRFCSHSFNQHPPKGLGVGTVHQDIQTDHNPGDVLPWSGEDNAI